jgi:BirA family biotin operon repressor/biotin-[acetyl-CoA-carboxylase] ligase
MLVERLADAVASLPDGWTGRYYASVESTQDEAKVAVRAGAPSRSIFVADFQRAGRGRQGRTWQAPPGASLMASFVFRESHTQPIARRWTSLLAVSLVETIDGFELPVRAAIKWPNDVMLGDRKVAGILAETSWDGRELVAIVGVGVNVNSSAADLREISGSPTSLSIANGRSIDRGQLLMALVRETDRWLQRPTDEMFLVWQARLWGRGQLLRLSDLGSEEEVIVLGAEADGALRVRLSSGAERTTTTGELII